MNWNELQDARLAVITELASRAPSGSIGRTALMKFCYLLQAVRGVPLGYRFTLYAYGPFDSSVLSDLGTAESLRAVHSSVEIYPGGYGYKIQPGDRRDAVLQDGSSFVDQHRESIEWVIREFGTHGSADLELESTIVYVDRESALKPERMTIDSLAHCVRDVKPHFAEKYVREKASELSAKGLLKTSYMASVAG